MYRPVSGHPRRTGSLCTHIRAKRMLERKGQELAFDLLFAETMQVEELDMSVAW